MQKERQKEGEQQRKFRLFVCRTTSREKEIETIEGGRRAGDRGRQKRQRMTRQTEGEKGRKK